MSENISEMNEIDMASILGDRYSAMILMATNIKPKSALEISHKYGIPIAACYRRINILLKHGFIVKDERVLTREGKRMWLYLSNIHMMNISYSNGKVHARCELRNGYVNECLGSEEYGRIEVI